MHVELGKDFRDPAHRQAVTEPICSGDDVD